MSYRTSRVKSRSKLGMAATWSWVLVTRTSFRQFWKENRPVTGEAAMEEEQMECPKMPTLKTNRKLTSRKINRMSTTKVKQTSKQTNSGKR